MKNAKQWLGVVGVLAVVVAILSTGCGGGGGMTGPSGTPTPAARAALRGRVVVETSDDVAPPIGGATVAVVGANPAITTTSAPDGTFTLSVPLGGVAIRVTTAGYWGALTGLEIPAAGLADLEFALTSETAVDDTGAGLGRPLSSANGLVIVVFANESGKGGESASISAASDPPYVLVTDVGYVQGNTLAANSPTAVIFTNVAPGSTGITVAGVAGTNTCALAPVLAAWPVEAKTITYAVAICQ